MIERNENQVKIGTTRQEMGILRITAEFWSAFLLTLREVLHVNRKNFAKQMISFYDQSLQKHCDDGQ